MFHSFGSEISTDGVLAGLAARHVRLALPLLVDGVLEACAYELGDWLESGGTKASLPAPMDVLVYDPNCTKGTTCKVVGDI